MMQPRPRNPFRRAIWAAWTGLGFWAAAAPAQTEEQVYETPAAFVATAFGGRPPAAETVAITGPLAEKAARILGHPYRAGRARYWRVGTRTAWVLEEIGKTKPITAGIVVDGGRIASMKVLIYRESIGWEVRRPAFTAQFQGAALNGTRLSRTVNGIHGATLSSDALRKLGALALLLHGTVSGG